DSLRSEASAHALRQHSEATRGEAFAGEVDQDTTATRLLTVAAIGSADEDDGMRPRITGQKEVGKKPDTIGHGDRDVTLDRDAEAWWWQPQQPRLKLRNSPRTLWCGRALRWC